MLQLAKVNKVVELFVFLGVWGVSLGFFLFDINKNNMFIVTYSLFYLNCV